jgi:hypothetical protein
MRFSLERTAEPEFEPVTLAQMKTHLREYESMTAMDSTISALITAGREWAESFTGRALIEQTWRLTVERDSALPADSVSTNTTAITGQWMTTNESEILLRRSPVLSIVSINSIDTAGVSTEIDADSYSLRLASSKWPKVVALNGAKWSQSTLEITFKAGYPDDIPPKRFVQAIKLWVQANYNPNVEEFDGLMRAAENLIRSERVELSLA